MKLTSSTLSALLSKNSVVRLSTQVAKTKNCTADLFCGRCPVLTCTLLVRGATFLLMYTRTIIAGDLALATASGFLRPHLLNSCHVRVDKLEELNGPRGGVNRL